LRKESLTAELSALPYDKKIDVLEKRIALHTQNTARYGADELTKAHIESLKKICEDLLKTVKKE